MIIITCLHHNYLYLLQISHHYRYLFLYSIAAFSKPHIPHQRNPINNNNYQVNNNSINHNNSRDSSYRYLLYHYPYYKHWLHHLSTISTKVPLVMPIILSIRNMLIRANRFRNSRNHRHHHQNDNINRRTSISNDDDTKDDHDGNNDGTDGDCKKTHGRRIVKTVRRYCFPYPPSFMWWSVMLPIAIGLIYQHYIDSKNISSSIIATIHTTVSTSATTTTAEIKPSR